MQYIHQRNWQRRFILIDECKRKGTLQFSRLARLGFVANSLLKSLVEEGAMSQQDYDNFVASIHTVAKEFMHDSIALQGGAISKETYLDKYGHLRPGTYDITSQRYDSANHYFEHNNDRDTSNIPKKPFVYTITPKSRKVINDELKAHGLKITATQLLEFVKKATEAREYSKFLFTKCLSDAIELIADYGETIGFSREDLSYLQMNDVKKALVMSSDEVYASWSAAIVSGKKLYNLDRHLILPSVIFDVQDLEIIKHYDSRPNYITKKRVTAELIILERATKQDVYGKIIAIEAADPGYDWIFAKNPAGLITRYGGPASHMSIRCSESSLPAAIGIGDKNFEMLNSGDCIMLDCENEKMTITTSVR